MSAAINGFDVDSGERVFDPSPGKEEANEAFRSDLFETPEWVELRSKFDLESGMDVVNAVIDTVPAPKILSRVQSIIRKVVLAGGLTRYGSLTPRTVAEPEREYEPERDSRGHVLGEPQKKWREYRQFSETHSSDECRNRARVDSDYASFRRLNFEREAAETPRTKFPLAGQSPVKEKPAVTPELIAWAQEYRKTPVEKVRQLRSPAFNALGYEAYMKTQDTALAAGLI